MSTHIGSGYGSEFHLMRWMGRYRNKLNGMIEELIGGRVIKWLDFIPGGEYNNEDLDKVVLPDKEWVGLDFLKEEKPVVCEKWKSFWPQSGNQQNWDAVGKIDVQGKEHWLLVEAKAHIGEIESHPDPSEKSRIKIKEAFSQTQNYLGIKTEKYWICKYYQCANRLAAHYFLNNNGVPCSFLFIYFCGDKNPNKAAICPKDREGWQSSLKTQDEALGLYHINKEKFRIYSLFVNVAP